MNAEERLIAQIVDNFMDDEPRSEYAAWLDSQYRTRAAEFIRVQSEWDATDPNDPHFHELSRRELQLRQALYGPWLDRLAAISETSLKVDWYSCVEDPACMSAPNGRKRARRSVRNLMRRFGWNISLLANRLRESGYRFVFPEHAYVPLSSDQASSIVDYQVQSGWNFPVSLTAFLHEIGSVNFMGTHPFWSKTGYYFEDVDRKTPYTLSDPLVVDVEMMIQLFSSPEQCDSLRIEVAPDFHHKSGVSGGGAQALNFGNNEVEATIEDSDGDGNDLCFVRFLDNACFWCGFPGLAYYDDNSHEFLEELRRGLLLN